MPDRVALRPYHSTDAQPSPDCTRAVQRLSRAFADVDPIARLEALLREARASTAEVAATEA